MNTVYDRLQILLTARDQTRSVLEKASARIKSFGKGVVDVVSKVALATAAVAAFGQRQFAELEQGSKLVNTQVGEYQKLVAVIQQFNPSANIDNISEGLLTLRERFAEAREGAGEATEVFKKLGLDSNLENVHDQLDAVRQVMAGLNSDTERLQFTRILFGDTDGNAILGYLRGSAEQVERITTAVENSGQLFTDQDINNMQVANRALAQLKLEANTTKQLVFARLAPVIADAANHLTAFIFTVRSSGDAIKDSVFFKLHRFLRDVLFEAISTAAGWVTSLAKKIKNLLFIPINSAAEGDGPLSNVAKGIIEDSKNSVSAIDTYKNKLEELRREQRTFVNGNAGGGTGGGGDTLGGGGASGGESVVDRVNRENAEAQKILEREQKEKLKMMEAEKKAQQKLIADTERERFEREKNRVDAIEQERIKLQRLKDQADDTATSLSKIAGAFGTIAESTGGSTSKAFKKFQKLQIALSTMAAISAGIQAASSPAVTAGGPLAVFAAYASVVGTLFAGIQQIRNLDENSGGSGSPPALTPSAQGPANDPGLSTPPGVATGQPQAQLNVTLVGDVFDGDTVKRLFDIANETPGIGLDSNVINGLENAA